MELTYKGKNAIVTGASGGMGLEISKMLSENNIKVLMLDIQSPSRSFLSENVNCIYKKVDVTNLRKLNSIIEKYFKENKSIDYLINTTGVLWFNKDVSYACIKSDGGHDAFLMKNDNYFEIMRTYIEANMNG